MEAAAARRRVALTAAASRAAVLAWAAASRAVVGAYDSSADLGCDAAASANGLGRLLRPLGGACHGQLPALGTNWDAAYFARIAAHGYEFEQFHAFWPLAPAAARAASWPLGALGLGPAAAVTWGGVVVSNACFVLAALALHELSRRVLRNDRVAERAALLFCVGPASVFMSAFYTEAPFALLALLGMLIAHEQGPALARLCAAGFVFGLATLTRPNGALLGGYLGFEAIRPMLEARRATAAGVVAAAARLVIPAPLIAAPLVAVLGSAFQAFCGGAEAVDRPPWCADRLPNVYGYVQDAYWNVGFLRYYEAKQVPNFALAAPAAVLCARGAWRFAGPEQLRLVLGAAPPSAARERALRTLPHGLHMLALLLFCVAVMHVQVLTRFISACPAFYWTAATEPAGRLRDFVLAHFAVYFLLGPAMFAGFFPWS